MVRNTRPPTYTYPPPPTTAKPEVEQPGTPRTSTSHGAWVDTPYPPRPMLFTYPEPPPVPRPAPQPGPFHADPLPPVRVESVPPEDDPETTPRAPSIATFPPHFPAPSPTPARGAQSRLPSHNTSMSETRPAWLNQPHRDFNFGNGTPAQFPPPQANLPPRPPGFTPPPVLTGPPPKPTPMPPAPSMGANNHVHVGANTAPHPTPVPATAMENSLLKTLLDPPPPPKPRSSRGRGASANRKATDGANANANLNFEAIWRAMGDDRKWYFNLGASPPNTCKIVVDRKAGTVCARPAHRDTRGMMCYGHLCRLGAEFEGVLDHD